jgi:hypothetical protein
VNRLIGKIKALNTRGETLMEGIISILIFVVLIAAVTTIVSTAFRIIANSELLAQRLQQAANEVLEHEDGAGGVSVVFTIGTSPDDETISIPVEVFTVNNPPGDNPPGIDFFRTFAPTP